MAKKRAPATNGDVIPVADSVVEILLPIGDVQKEAYRPRHINGHLDTREAEGWKRFVAGINAQNKFGRPLTTVDGARIIGNLIMDKIEANTENVP